MSRRYFSCLQLLGPALVDDEGTEFARPLEPRSYGTRIASHISMDEWHSREADVLTWMRRPRDRTPSRSSQTAKQVPQPVVPQNETIKIRTGRWLPAYVPATASLDRNSV